MRGPRQKARRGRRAMTWGKADRAGRGPGEKMPGGHRQHENDNGDGNGANHCRLSDQPATTGALQYPRRPARRHLPHHLRPPARPPPYPPPSAGRVRWWAGLTSGEATTSSRPEPFTQGNSPLAPKEDVLCAAAARGHQVADGGGQDSGAAVRGQSSGLGARLGCRPGSFPPVSATLAINTPNQ